MVTPLARNEARISFDCGLTGFGGWEGAAAVDGDGLDAEADGLTSQPQTKAQAATPNVAMGE